MLGEAKAWLGVGGVMAPWLRKENLWLRAYKSPLVFFFNYSISIFFSIGWVGLRKIRDGRRTVKGEEGVK